MSVYFFAAIGGFFIFYKTKGIFIMNKIEYIADGETKNFTFNFSFFDVDDVCVQINGVTQTSGYTVNYVTNGENADIPYTGTNVAFNSAPDANDKITIYRSIKLNRPVDYQPTVKIDPVALNQDITFAIEVLKDFSQSLADFNSKYADLINFPLLETLNTKINEMSDKINNLDADNFSTTGKSDIVDLTTLGNKKIDITDNGDGTKFTAPAAGWVVYRKTSTAENQYAELQNSTTGMNDMRFSSSGSQSLTPMIPCSKGDDIRLWCSAEGTTKFFKFIYAKGDMQ